ncbi:MAG: mercury(II) reductase [Thaumarchaeota archaeon]|nr:mercury(II) reductase [Nitrososphaerota archaeon]
MILGRGAAAFAAAIKASELSKARIGMIGSGPIGGTCVNVGCVPSKYLLESSHSHFYPQHPKFQGIAPSTPNFDFSKVMSGLRELVSGFRESKYEKVLGSYRNIEMFEGKARFVSPTEVQVLNESNNNGGGEENKKPSAVIKGRKIIIATGSRPTAPPIEGLGEAGYLTSDTVWQIDELPRSITIIGGGAIGLELGQAFLHFGSEVSIVEVLPRIVTQAEPEISELLQEKLSEEGMKFYIRAKVNNVGKKKEKDDGRTTKFLEVSGANGKNKFTTIECDEILVATGRVPNTAELALERAGVKTDSNGAILTDASMRTNVPHIYAAGDCISKKLMLETLAAREGVVATTNANEEGGGGSRMSATKTIDYLSTPWAVFTNPQIASVGVTEEELMKQIGTCSCRVVSLDDIPKAFMLGETKGLIKLIINPNNDKVVGLHILSPIATEYVLEGVYAIKRGLTYEDIVNTTHVFPTLAEGVKLAAQSFVRDIAKMSCCVE